MTTRTFSQTSLGVIKDLPPAKRGAGFRTVSVLSYSSSSTSSDETVEVPYDLNSRELLEFFGFQEPVIDEIWPAWQARDLDGFEDWVIDAALYYVQEMGRRHDAVDATDDWDGALKGMGLNTELRQRILDPEFTALRLTESACFWAQDTIKEAFEYLTKLSERIEKKKSGQTSRVNSPDSVNPPQPALRHHHARSQDHSMSRANRRSDPPPPPPPAPIGRALPEPPTAIENCTILYKGGSEASFERCLSDDSTVDMALLSSAPPTDFHPIKDHYTYLTKYHDVAMIYARYLGRRLPPVKTAVLHIAVPNHLLADAREIYGEAWRNLVWLSRNRAVRLAIGGELPEALRQYENAPILIGPVCKNPTAKIKEMSSKYHLEEIRRPGSAKGSQLVIQSFQRQQAIAAACKNCVWVVPCN